MPDTPIYAITYPASTGLVTDGASNMQTISTDVETALNRQAATNDGRNWLDNPQFSINYRNAQTITAATNGYLADRWLWSVLTGATATFSRSTIALATAGLDASITRGATINTTASAGTAAGVYVYQSIDAVERLSGRTVVVSFYAKASVNATKVGVRLVQSFGTGGTPSANVDTAMQNATLTTSWARYSLTFTLGSVNGKTLGTNNDDATRLELWTSGGSGTAGSGVGHQIATVDITGLQAEIDYLTPWELRYDWLDTARCSRFFQTSYPDSVWLLLGGAGAAGQNGKVEHSATTNGGNACYYTFKFPIQMQRTPTMRFYTQTAGLLGSWEYSRNTVATTAIAVGTATNGLSPLGFILVNSTSLGAVWVPVQMTGQWAASIDGW